MSIFGLQDNETALADSYITNTFVSQFYQPKIALNNLLSYNFNFWETRSESICAGC